MSQAAQPPSGGTPALHPFWIGVAATRQLAATVRTLDVAVDAYDDTLSAQDVVDRFAAIVDIDLRTVFDLPDLASTDPMVLGTAARAALAEVITCFRDKIDGFDSARIAKTAIVDEFDACLGELIELLRRARRARTQGSKHDGR